MLTSVAFKESSMTAAAEVSLARDANTLYHLAMMDGLTAIYNHGYGQEQVVKELRRVSRPIFPSFLAIIDLDHSKRSTTGTVISLETIVFVRLQVPSKTLRSTDILYRSGGEEFAEASAGYTLHSKQS